MVNYDHILSLKINATAQKDECQPVFLPNLISQSYIFLKLKQLHWVDKINS